nr:hypothetical protein BaRGS_006981 [Batillaria attramentaria]
MSKSVAVIGGGCSGLTAIKCCVNEGLEPVCFERTDEVGGLWHYTDHVRNRQACVMRSTVINTSKEMMCFSDYPIPKEYPNYMHNSQVLQYFKDYAEHFKLYDHIQYNAEVVKVQRAADFLNTGRWDLHVRDHKSGEERTETFDAVLVCTGYHAEKNEPTFPGLSDFKGRVLHSHEYREPSEYFGKRILVVGIGSSGADIATELSRCGQVFLSTRRGAWVFKRLAAGMPGDIVRTTRLNLAMSRLLPTSFVHNSLKKLVNSQLDHDLYGLTPTYPPFMQHPTINDDLGNRIACGSVKVKADVKKFTPTGVEFVDGTVEENIDEGEVKLPSASEMWKDIRTKENAMAQRCWKSQRHTVQVAWIPFMDELAELNGCKPDIVSLIKTDPVLAWHVITGPCTPYQYRLMGPGKWAGARDAILTTMDRSACPIFGLAAIKCCVDERLEPVCFERTDEVGGLWHYTDNVRNGQACVMRSTVINTSKEMTCFSDYPIPKELPSYMHNLSGCSGLAAIKCCVDEGLEPVCFERTDEVGGLWHYTDHVCNGQACVMRSTVINTSKEMTCFSDYPIPKEYPNYMHNSQVLQYFKDYVEHFKLYVRDHKSGEERTETFDAVLVCTGYHAEKNEPTFPGLSDFKGRVVHSNDYREPSEYFGKRILVIGIGSTGADLAVELSRCGQVFLSTRRGAWVFKRLAAGMPGDIVRTTRLNLAMSRLLPTSFVHNSLKKMVNSQLDHDLYGLTPTFPPLTQNPTVNDDLGNRIACGSVKVKAEVKKFTPTGVEFVDGTVEENIDEGEVKLPSASEMWKDIRTKENAIAQRELKSQRHPVQTPWIPFMDELAELNGCKPDIASLIKTDPVLAWHVITGPCTPYQYRLMGPGKWAGARDAILTTMDRIRRQAHVLFYSTCQESVYRVTHTDHTLV